MKGWQRISSELLLQVMSEHDISAAELARKLKQAGVNVSGQAIRNKLGRGTFSAAFFFAAVACIRGAKVRATSEELMKHYSEEVAKSESVRQTLDALQAEGVNVRPEVAKLLEQQFRRRRRERS